MSHTERIDGARVVQHLEELIEKALRARASDIHITPRESRYEVRFRIDGVMVDRSPMPMLLGAHVASRIKVLGRMDISDKLVPQDGVFTHVSDNGNRTSMRCSTFPSFHGEKLVLRLLRTRGLMPLEKLGLDGKQLGTLERISRRNGGMLVVTGPTGSGKTSTLYAMLRKIDTRRRNVCTLEDPIEVELRDVVQGQLNRKRGFDFANGLRAILRQDPDVIMVGEIRDSETARIAVQASLTGHLVLTTMHTASVPETIDRLVDLGLERYIVASALLGVVAQRLVREICTTCRVRETPARLLRLLPEVGFELPAGIEPQAGLGCQDCLDTGFSGRVGLFEVVSVTDELRTLIKRAGAGPELKSWLAAQGIPTLRRVGVDLVQQGVTSLDEVLRLT